MPLWIYEIPPLQAALIIMVFVEAVSLVGLFLARRFLVPRLHYHDGINDAVSGTVQAIGVFYGITVGLIAVGVWDTHTNATDLVSKEAAAIGGVYRDLGGYPSPLREELRSELRDYTTYVIEQEWPSLRKGKIPFGGITILTDLQSKLYAFEPATQGQAVLHGETLRALNILAENRRLRLLTVNSGLSSIMWAVIWVGAVISIGVAYFYNILDPKMHALLVALMGGFLAIVLFMITVNDKPFYGYLGTPPDAYQTILERLKTVPK
jgi:uncharacterized MnhB-related membrane protein